VVNDFVRQLAEDATLWSVGEVTTRELVRLACDALVGDLDSQSLRELAGASPEESQYEIEDLLERVGHAFGFVVYERDSESGRLAAARILAAQCVVGGLPPRELASWMHTRIKHGHEDRRVEALVSLDDRYDVAETMGNPVDEIDRAVLVAAAQLLEPDDAG
jgi:hypothetical protein